MICTDCYSNLVIFSEFKNICKNSDELLKKYQINKAESSTDTQDVSHGTKGNGKCKSIRNSEEMAHRIKDTALKKSHSFIENMKSFYFLLNQIEDIENNGGVIIKNEISSESLIPTVEINIKNEVIYPNEVIMESVIQQAPETSGEQKRKRRKNNKRKNINGQQATMEINTMDGNIVTRQIVLSNDPSHQNLQMTTQNDNEMVMLTVKPVEQDQQQHHTIQIHSSKFLPNHTIPLNKTFVTFFD